MRCSIIIIIKQVSVKGHCTLDASIHNDSLTVSQVLVNSFTSCQLGIWKSGLICLFCKWSFERSTWLSNSCAIGKTISKAFSEVLQPSNRKINVAFPPPSAPCKVVLLLELSVRNKKTPQLWMLGTGEVVGIVLLFEVAHYCDDSFWTMFCCCL